MGTAFWADAVYFCGAFRYKKHHTTSSRWRYNSLLETSYLMKSPANARRLLDAVERLEAGAGEAHELIDLD